jgi:hypothetical protein
MGNTDNEFNRITDYYIVILYLQTWMIKIQSLVRKNPNSFSFAVHYSMQ